MPTLIELKKLATTKKIKGRSKMNKAGLLKALGLSGNKPVSKKQVRTTSKKQVRTTSKKRVRKVSKKRVRKVRRKPHKAFTKPLTTKEIEVLLGLTGVVRDNASYKILVGKLKKLRGPVPRNYKSQYYYPFAVRMKEANAAYKKSLARIDKEIAEDKAEAKKDGEDYTLEEENKARKFLKKLATELRAHMFATAENNRNDLENYAYSLLVEGDLD
jgi:hypothetical protein